MKLEDFEGKDAFIYYNVFGLKLKQDFVNLFLRDDYDDEAMDL